MKFESKSTKIEKKIMLGSIRISKKYFDLSKNIVSTRNPNWKKLSEILNFCFKKKSSKMEGGD